MEIWFLLNIKISLNGFIIIIITTIIKSENSSPACSHSILIYVLVSKELYHLFACVSNILPCILGSCKCESAKNTFGEVVNLYTKI